MRRLRELMNRGVALLLAAVTLIVSCSMPVTGPGHADPRQLVSTAGRLIDENIKVVRQAIADDISGGEDITELDGYEIATRALGEEGGEEYLTFCLETERFESIDDVLDAASPLVPASELERIRSDVEAYEARLLREAEPLARMLTPDEQEEFLAALKALVIKTAVLLTAAVVYAFVPELIFWGKITAAAAVAVAAGVVSTTILTIIEHYKLDRELDESFEAWLEDVVTVPSASWAIAAAMINLGSSLGRSPVLTAIIIGIFTIFNITDEVQVMLELNED